MTKSPTAGHGHVICMGVHVNIIFKNIYSIMSFYPHCIPNILH